jgi:hypothetical protein
MGFSRRVDVLCACHGTDNVSKLHLFLCKYAFSPSTLLGLEQSFILNKIHLLLIDLMVRNFVKLFFESTVYGSVIGMLSTVITT